MPQIIAPDIDISATAWRGVIVDAHDLGAEELFAVTIRRNFFRPTRRWFTDHPAALTYALEAADKFQLALIDLALRGSE